MSSPPGWPNVGAPTGPPPPAEPPSSYRWAEVTGTGPLRIQLDGQTAPLAVTPDTLQAGLGVGDRVLILQIGKRVIVLGRSGG